MNRKKQRVHDWRLLKWPVTVTFTVYSLLLLLTGYTEGGTESFLGVLGICLGVDAILYVFYCFLLSRDEEDANKLWAVFILFYGLLAVPQLQTLWELMKARAVV